MYQIDVTFETTKTTWTKEWITTIMYYVLAFGLVQNKTGFVCFGRHGQLFWRNSLEC